MTLLVLGLVVFLGAHSSRIFAEGWRTRFIAANGEMAWKGLYSVVSIAGFALMVWGYGQARLDPVAVWNPPVAMRHVAALLTLVAFVILPAAYIRGSRIKARVGHPMVLAVKVWALAHLLANGSLADIVLFGAFLVWAVLDYIASRKRDRAAGTTYPVGPVSKDIAVVGAGLVAWVVFALWLHGPLIGVRPFG